MEEPYIREDTLDDLMRVVLERIFSGGSRIHPTKGEATELTGVLLELSNPRARLSRTETRGKAFSALGELCWYLAGTNRLDFIQYYIPGYKAYADGDIIFGGYGPRLFNWNGLNQFENVLARLRRKPTSRRAVLQLFDARDITEPHKDVPCTCTLQFLVRQDRLHLLASMRSNDVFLGLPHDFFSFTMLQEIMARSLSLEPGTYKHVVGSLHLYDPNRDSALQFLEEGWQATDLPMMPPMPEGDPWPAIHHFLAAEASIRTKTTRDLELEQVDVYWADLIRLLLIFRCNKEHDGDRMRELAAQIGSQVYVPFINRLLEKPRRTMAKSHSNDD